MSKACAENISWLPEVPVLLEKGACQACGTTRGLGRRRYCSRACRQQLVAKLNISASLLRAIRTRYATFSFTSDFLELNVVVSGCDEVFSFILSRTPCKKPAEDLADLTEELGRVWWRAHQKQGSRHQAGLSVLSCAHTGRSCVEDVRPVDRHSPLVRAGFLTVLKLDKAQLTGPDPISAIKSAYRAQAMAHHPDRNGDPAMFRRIHQAYETLLQWSQNPRMQRLRGLPGKWSFNGQSWAPPMRLSR